MHPYTLPETHLQCTHPYISLILFLRHAYPCVDPYKLEIRTHPDKIISDTSNSITPFTEVSCCFIMLTTNERYVQILTSPYLPTCPFNPDTKLTNFWRGGEGGKGREIFFVTSEAEGDMYHSVNTCIMWGSSVLGKLFICLWGGRGHYLTGSLKWEGR